jgi:CDP-diacylglycerol---glycerol-3-phosphate 3-phosphatidyltransferase
MNLPNSITYSRLAGIPLVIYGLYQTSPTWHWISFTVFLIAAATDWLDGYLARKLNQITELGKFLDPLVDKLLILIPYLTLIELRVVPAIGVSLILLRELVIAGWRVNQTQVSGANLWGKAKTVVQISSIAFLIIPIPAIQTWGIGVFWAAVAITLISGGIYLSAGLQSKPVNP